MESPIHIETEEDEESDHGVMTLSDDEYDAVCRHTTDDDVQQEDQEGRELKLLFHIVSLDQRHLPVIFIPLKTFLNSCITRPVIFSYVVDYHNTVWTKLKISAAL